MSETKEPRPPDSPVLPPGQPTKVPQMPHAFWPVFLLLALLLAGLWAWSFSVSSALQPPDVDYSVFYGWLQEGKVSSVVLHETALEFTLLKPEDIGRAQPMQSFRTVRPEGDTALLPALH